MNKAQWLSAGLKFLSGGGNASPEIQNINDPRVIEKFISLAFDSLMDLDRNVKSEMDKEAGRTLWKYAQFTKRFVQPIVRDALADQYYSELPKQIFSIKDNQGIVQISPTKEQSTAFLPRRPLGNFLMNGLDVNTLDNIFYTLEGRNVYYAGNINGTWKSVLMKLAVKFEELDDDDYVNVPDGDAGNIFQMMLKIMTNKPPSDLIDDNTPLQTVK